MRKLPAGIRSVVGSALLAAGYAAAFHLLMWVTATVLYALPAGILRFVLPIGILLVGMILFFVLRPKAADSVTFYGVLLLVQVILTTLMVATPAVEWLTALTGNDHAVDSPDGNLSSLYLLYVWLLVGPLSGVLYFFFAVIFIVRDALRSTMGYIPRSPKKNKEKPKK